MRYRLNCLSNMHLDEKTFSIHLQKLPGGYFGSKTAYNIQKIIKSYSLQQRCSFELKGVSLELSKSDNTYIFCPSPHPPTFLGALFGPKSSPPMSKNDENFYIVLPKCMIVLKEVSFELNKYHLTPRPPLGPKTAY